jgi:hypothetical protein
MTQTIYAHVNKRIIKKESLTNILEQDEKRISKTENKVGGLD